MSVEAVISTQVIDTTSVGRSIMTAANAAAVRSAIDFSEAVDDEVASLLVAGANITITYNDAANTLTIASTAGGLSGTGSVDNAILRADGTGGATLQSSAIVIDDLFTSSPNNTVNYVCLRPTGGTTNVSVAVAPKGTGAFSLQVPDGTATGGNARGISAVDFCMLRSSASQVATGYCSFAAGVSPISSSYCSTAFGNNPTASGNAAFSCNTYTQATALSSFAANTFTQATAEDTFAIGTSSIASALSAFAHGRVASANRHNQYAHGLGNYSGQFFRLLCSRLTTNATPTTLMLDNSSLRLSIASGRLVFANVFILGSKSDGTAAACYQRKVAIKNVGGTTSLVGSVETIGTDIEDNSATDVAITADDTNDALQINVTGISGETWRWMAVLEGVEMSFGT